MKRVKAKHHWPRRRLGDATKVLSGATPKTSVAEYWNGEIVWLTPKDLGALESIEVSTSERRITRQGFDSCSAQLIPPNSVVMSSRAPIGHLAINTVPVCTNQGCKSFVPKSDLDTRFLYWALRGVMPEIQHLGDGCTFDEVSKADLESFEIPVPPLAEQRRLVARIEALMSRLEQARQARQAALAEAELIMQSHRSRLLDDYAEENLTRFGELVAETQLGLVRSKEQQSEAHPWPYLKMNNITSAGTLDMSKLTSVEASADEVKKFRLADGDFLFNTRNSYELVGKTAVWSDTGEPVLYNNNIMRIRFRPGVESRFVNAVFLTPAVQSQLDGFKKQTTSVCAIYWKNLKEVEIPVPSPAEQRRIVARLDALAAKQTELRRLQTETEAELAAFTPALLAKAFRGEL